uniref:Uncharacterized protein n=1 Tax=Palpitomonas bilix TaxID=652834 RepID=A0A7S3DC27_9EUKA|mmetsp:Transcript_31137/g.81712  ORF Transcript_31137/g.81712 Transcript_31137/m.81712 type:complete len:142 (+) Transcript_31137:290-715(+)|eukprot:CAMPEP_0113881584 /NCGR_PEP_ID=MMETSP0780_2-20120614/8459_1 /TAXON_ID=652834 /ORGANISM="Palpitomonas bilix" /LENGTH=141 /DNA_ID=CAMNT_0000868461 /DNA_START=285 /DNA_END=710 /DNA_ORIENTATION=- /assembly_acc=CAM_ASM_000599
MASKKTTKIGIAQTHQLNSNASNIANLLENAQTAVEQLNTEIKADDKGIEDWERQLGYLTRRKRDLEKRIEANTKWATSYDGEIGPFTQKYDNFTSDLGKLYDNAKEKHAGGLDILKEEFEYHPAFKRWHDYFSAVPFKPE